MISKENTTGIILAGGKSKRFGEEKGLYEYRGKPLVRYSIDVLKPFCGKIIISANNRIDEYASLRYDVVQDVVKDAGPLGGIFSCLKCSETQHNFVLSCDMPFVNGAVLEVLAENIKNFQAVVPVHETFLVEPLCAYYNTNVLSELQNSLEIGEFRVKSFLKRVRVKTVLFDKKFPWYSDKIFRNMNRLEDLG